MLELYSKIFSYIPMIWRWRWLALCVAWVVCVIGWSAVAVIPDKYESHARIYVDTNSLLRPLLAGLAIDTDPARTLAVMQRTLVSRPNLEEVIRVTDLDLTTKSSIEKERLIAQLQREISVRTDGNNLFSISYENTDPQVAKNVVQALLTIFVEGNLGASRRGMDTALRFIDDQIRNYEKQLEEAEQRMARFKQENAEFLPRTSGDYHQRLTKARSELTSLQAEVADAVARRDELRHQLASVPEYIEFTPPAYAQGGPGGGQGGPTRDLQVRIAELEKNIDDMLLRYTEEHPDVIAARRLLNTLRERLDERTQASSEKRGETGESGAGPQKGENKVPNQVYQQIKLQSVQADADIASLQERIVRQKEKIAKLESMANKIPQVEIQFAKLNRDYGIIKHNYEQLLARKETAVMSEERDTKGEKVQFRIIDPPRVPLIPAGNKRKLFLSMVLFGGIGAGAGLGFLIGNLQRTFFTAWQLSKAVDIPILGSVSMHLTTAQRRWRTFNLASFCFVFLVLLGTFGGLQATEASVGLPHAVPADVIDKAVKKLPPVFSEWWQTLSAKLREKI